MSHANPSSESYTADELLPLIYGELRRLAAARLANEPTQHTLQATALVHEVYLRLIGNDPSKPWNGKAHFFGAAAEAMRRILVDEARRKRTKKHGDDRTRVPLADVELYAPARSEQLLALDEALAQLEQIDGPAATLAKLRYFAGMTIPEAAEVLAISPRSADALWAYARAWLLDQLRDPAMEIP